jgi:uncharacterized protein DUF4386
LATGDNRAILGGGYLLGQLLGNGLSLTLLIFGVVSLYAYLANSSVRALAFGAMVSSIFGIALNLTGVGVFAYAVPALSRSFLDGHPQSIRISEYIFGAPFGITAILALLLYLAGFVLFGVAIWRSGVLPRWAGVLVAVHAPLLLMGAFHFGGFVRGGAADDRGRWVDCPECLATTFWPGVLPGRSAREVNFREPPSKHLGE